MRVRVRMYCMPSRRLLFASFYSSMKTTNGMHFNTSIRTKHSNKCGFASSPRTHAHAHQICFSDWNGTHFLERAPLVFINLKFGNVENKIQLKFISPSFMRRASFWINSPIYPCKHLNGFYSIVDSMVFAHIYDFLPLHYKCVEINSTIRNRIYWTMVWLAWWQWQRGESKQKRDKLKYAMIHTDQPWEHGTAVGKRAQP